MTHKEKYVIYFWIFLIIDNHRQPRTHIFEKKSVAVKICNNLEWLERHATMAHSILLKDLTVTAVSTRLSLLTKKLTTEKAAVVFQVW